MKIIINLVLNLQVVYHQDRTEIGMKIIHKVIIYLHFLLSLETIQIQENQTHLQVEDHLQKDLDHAQEVIQALEELIDHAQEAIQALEEQIDQDHHLPPEVIQELEKKIK